VQQAPRRKLPLEEKPVIPEEVPVVRRVRDYRILRQPGFLQLVEHPPAEATPTRCPEDPRAVSEEVGEALGRVSEEPQAVFAPASQGAHLFIVMLMTVSTELMTRGRQGSQRPVESGTVDHTGWDEESGPDTGLSQVFIGGLDVAGCIAPVQVK